MMSVRLIKKILYQYIMPGLQLLPEKVGYWGSGKVMRRYVWQYERNWVLNYQYGLKMAFPNAKNTSQWTKTHFGLMGREALDAYKISKVYGKSNFLQAELDVCDLEKSNPSKGKLIIMAHLGRPIILSSKLGLSGYKVGMLSQVIDERNPHLDSVTRNFLQFKMFHTVRLAGGRWVTTADNLRLLYKALESGETIIMMMDLVEPNTHRQIKVPFLNGQLKLPPGIVRIAEKASPEIYYGEAKDNDNYVLCRLLRLSDNPVEALTQAVKELEKCVVEQPWQWWQWNNLPLLWEKNNESKS